MTDKLIEILEGYGYEVILRSYLLAGDELPDTFITYEETDTTGISMYDNETHGIAWSYTVSIITTTPAKGIELARRIKNDFKGTPFTMRGLGTQFHADGSNYVGRNLYIKAEGRI